MVDPERRCDACTIFSFPQSQRQVQVVLPRFVRPAHATTVRRPNLSPVTSMILDMFPLWNCRRWPCCSLPRSHRSGILVEHLRKRVPARHFRSLGAELSDRPLSVSRHNKEFRRRSGFASFRIAAGLLKFKNLAAAGVHLAVAF
jgi:hypothetical protein